MTGLIHIDHTSADGLVPGVGTALKYAAFAAMAAAFVVEVGTDTAGMFTTSDGAAGCSGDSGGHCRAGVSAHRRIGPVGLDRRRA